MSQQNINQYVFNKWKLNPSWNNLDMSLASDETDFNEEVVFSTQLIGINDGNRLPIYFDLNNSNSSQQPTLNYGDFMSGNTLVSLNYYNPNNENLSCFTGNSLCDIGLVGTDNGLVPEMSGETIYFSMGLYTGTTKWDRYHFDRRTKLIPITSYTTEDITLTLDVDIGPGSIVAVYNLISDENLVNDVTINFTNVLGYTGGTILIQTGVTISLGNSSGQTIVTINENFDSLDRTSLITGVTSSESGSAYQIQVTANQTFAPVTPTLSITPTNTPLPQSPTPTPTNTPSNSVTPTTTVTPTQSPTQSPTQTQTPSVTPTITQTPTQSPTQSPTPSVTPTITQTPTQSPTQSPTPSVTPTITPTTYLIFYLSAQDGSIISIQNGDNITINNPFIPPTPTPTPTQSPTQSVTPTTTPTTTQTPTQSPTQTPTQSETLTPTPTTTVTPTQSPTQSPTQTPTQTVTPSASFGQSSTPTLTPTSTPTPTPVYNRILIQDGSNLAAQNGDLINKQP